MNQNANKGMDTHRYLWIVMGTLLLMCVVAIVFVGKEKTKVVPHAVTAKPTTAASPQ